MVVLLLLIGLVELFPPEVAGLVGAFNFQDVTLSDTSIGLMRLVYSFTPKVALEALLQYNGVDDLLSTNLRFSWLRQANTGLYVVFNDINGYDAYTGQQPDRSLIAKYTHLFDI